MIFSDKKALREEVEYSNVVAITDDEIGKVISIKPNGDFTGLTYLEVTAQSSDNGEFEGDAEEEGAFVLNHQSLKISANDLSKKGELVIGEIYEGTLPYLRLQYSSYPEPCKKGTVSAMVKP